MNAIAVIAALLLALLPPEADEKLKEFKRAFRSSKEPAQLQERRTAALKELTAGGALTAAHADALIDAHAQLEKELLPIEEKRRAFLRNKLKNKRLKIRADLDPLRKLQESIRAALMKMEEEAAVGSAAKRALSDSKIGLSLRIALAGRAKSLGKEGWRELERLLRRTKHPGELLTALAAARGLGGSSKPLGDRIISRLEHDEPAVREAAAAALATVCLPESIVPLVDCLEVEKGRTQQRIADALQILTHQSFGTSIYAWRKWLAKDGRDFISGKVELGGGKIARSASKSPTYHEIPMDGLSILYVLDSSNSMKNLMVSPKKKTGSEKETRFHRATNELIRALRSLPPYKRFNIITFDGKVRLFEAGMADASPKTSRKPASGSTISR